VDKSERRRINRAQVRKDKARKEARGAEAQARRWQALTAAGAAQASLARRDFERAADFAARATALAPKDIEIAELYVRASGRARGPRHAIAAFEHLIAVDGPTLPLLVRGRFLRRGTLAADARGGRFTGENPVRDNLNARRFTRGASGKTHSQDPGRRGR
jgi:hypothetical protein